LLLPLAREETTKLLLQPLHAALTATLAHLRAGKPWAALHGSAAEQQLLHGMARARALLDARLLAAQANAAVVERAAAARGGGGGACGGGAAGSRSDPMESGAMSAADAVEDLAARAARLTTTGGGFGRPPAGGAGGGGGGNGALAKASSGGARSGGGAAGSGGAAGGGAAAPEAAFGDPLVELLVAEVWPLAAAAALEGAAGRFLHQYAKATVLLLRARPDALLPLLPQMLSVCAAGFCQPGGYSLGEVLSASILAYCRVEGSRAPLDVAPHVLQVRGGRTAAGRHHPTRGCLQRLCCIDRTTTPTSFAPPPTPATPPHPQPPPPPRAPRAPGPLPHLGAS
jgi:hypothetical protein